MARESKRKRDERRFGRPERLADLFRAGVWACSVELNTDHGSHPFVSGLRIETSDAIETKVIDATNVMDYTISMKDPERFGYIESIVNATPPFDLCFVQFQTPEALSPQVRHAGWAIRTFSKGDEPEIVYEALARLPAPEVYGACRWVIVGTLSLGILAAPGTKAFGVMCPAAQAITFLDPKGNALQPPILSIPENLYPEWADTLWWWAHYSFFDCMLAFCFMNCRNVILSSVEPDARLNRERGTAGLKPFLRFHTINIEPMKRALRTEGAIESNGLKKALHICRGHFATYTDDNPLFGRFVGRFWKQSHVRGSLASGVVASDYRVSPPGAGTK